MTSIASLRILQVNSLFNGGGADNQTLELAAGLANLGDEVTLSVPAGSRWEPLTRQLPLRSETFPARSPLKRTMIQTWVRLLRERRIQIIHAHQGRDYWPAILAARLAGVGTRVLVTRHLMTRPRTLSRWLLLFLADVIAVSQAVERVLQRELCGPKNRVHQIYGGIDTARFQTERTAATEQFRERHGWPPAAVVFGVVGAFNLPGGKGQLEFLEAAAQLKQDSTDARFAIIGAGDMEEQLRACIAARGLSAVATMVPFTDDVPSIMNALDVLVHPALGTEALGLVLWEAMASGKPVIASRLDGIPEAFREGEHGLLAPPRNVPALAEAMRSLLRDADLRRRFGRAGCEYVRQNFSRAAQAKRVHDLYLRLLAR